MFWLIVLSGLSVAAVAATASTITSDGYGRPETRDRVSGRR
ncbi:MAG TPA: hypothetical protein VFU07_01295 [Candidatus Lumbricidophila sp.]|nr:hypothetical protein [Candidatus Lumbricidophila sp.]